MIRITDEAIVATRSAIRYFSHPATPWSDEQVRDVLTAAIPYLSTSAPEETLPDRGKMVKPKPGAPSGGYGGADAAEEAAHDLYKTGDLDAPDVIKDRNGEVVLGLCRTCGRGEVELTEPCTPDDALAIIAKLRAQIGSLNQEADRLSSHATILRDQRNAFKGRLNEAVEALTAIADGEGDAAVIAAQTLQSLGKEG